MYPGNLGCKLCNDRDIQTQDHLLNCQKIISNCEELFNNIAPKYKWIKKSWFTRITSIKYRDWDNTREVYLELI